MHTLLRHVAVYGYTYRWQKAKEEDGVEEEEEEQEEEEEEEKEEKRPKRQTCLASTRPEAHHRCLDLRISVDRRLMPRTRHTAREREREGGRQAGKQGRWERNRQAVGWATGEGKAKGRRPGRRAYMGPAAGISFVVLRINRATLRLDRPPPSPATPSSTSLSSTSCSGSLDLSINLLSSLCAAPRIPTSDP